MKKEQLVKMIREMVREEIGSKPTLEEDFEIQNYPELDKVVNEVARITITAINEKIRPIKSEMPYKAQYVLEELIKILQSKV